MTRTPCDRQCGVGHQVVTQNLATGHRHHQFLNRQEPIGTSLAMQAHMVLTCPLALQHDLPCGLLPTPNNLGCGVTRAATL
jgi:hypothetical protein